MCKWLFVRINLVNAHQGHEFILKSGQSVIYGAVSYVCAHWYINLHLMKWQVILWALSSITLAFYRVFRAQADWRLSVP
jgi:hypothetical protein